MKARHQTQPHRAPAQASDAQDLGHWLNEALAHHQAGRLAEAKTLYSHILGKAPKHADALHFMGLLACQIGQREAGLTSIRESVALHPNPIYYNNLGNALREAGEREAAADAYRNAIALKGDYAEAYSNLGNVLREQGDARGALEYCARALELHPGYAQAYNNLGNALKDLGEMTAAAASYGKAIESNPGFVEAHLNLGHVRKAAGEYEAALASYRTGVAFAPQMAAAHDSLAGLLLFRGDVDAAIEHYRQVTALEPRSVHAYNTLANALNGAGRVGEAIPLYEQAITLDPEFADGWHNLAHALRRVGVPTRAVVCARRAIELRGDTPSFHNNLGAILADLNQFDAALECYRTARALDPDFGESHTCVLFGQSYVAQWSAKTHLDDARYFGERMAALAKPYRHWPALDGSRARGARPLKVGFVSADFRKHPVGYFLECVLTHLDRTRIEPVAYSNGLQSDELTARIKPRFAAWHHVADMGDAALAQAIREEGIEILVDLSGHTGRNRLPMFAWRPAPVQVSWLGYFATTGLAEIDYVLADPHVVPPEEESQYVERIWRLPDCYLCFTLPEVPVLVSPLPALTNGYVTFGCFNNHKKLNDGVIALWSRLLQAVPGSRLLLKNHQLSEAAIRGETLARFAAHGIAAERLVLDGPSSREAYFAAYHQVDFALDPFPYPGGTTSVEGLWMGVPVLGRRGDRFLAHLGEMVLRTVGLAEWIASHDEDYLARAIAFARDLPALTRLRAGLRERVERSPLCDAQAFAGHLAAAFEKMWQVRVSSAQEVVQ